MTDDVRTLLRAAADRVPDRPGDLSAVERRARQRVRRGLAAAVAGVSAVALLAAVLLRPLPSPPPVIDGDERIQLDIGLCPPVLCDGSATSADDAVSVLAAVPAVNDITVLSAAAWRRATARAFDLPLEEVPAGAVASVVRVTVDPGAMDGGLPAVAQHLRRLIAGATVARAGAAAQVLGLDRFDPTAAVGPAEEVVTAEVAGRRLSLRVWPVEHGGRCMEVGDLVACLPDTVPGPRTTRASPVWGRPAEGVLCVWGAVGPDTERVTVTMADGVEGTGSVGQSRHVLAPTALACVAATVTHPQRFTEHHTDGSTATESGFAQATEVRHPDVVSVHDVRAGVEDALVAAWEREIEELSSPAERLEALTAEVGRLSETVDMVGRVAIDHASVPDTPDGDPLHGTVVVTATVTPSAGEPVCLSIVAESGEGDGPPVRVGRPTLWSPQHGCRAPTFQ